MKIDIITKLVDSSFIEKYGVFLDEIMQYPLENLNTVLKEMEDVLKGVQDSNSFTGICMEAKYDREKVSIFYYDDLQGEESTTSIYNLLKNYRDKLIDSPDLYEKL